MEMQFMERGGDGAESPAADPEICPRGGPDD